MSDTLNTLKVITRNGVLELIQVSKVLDRFPELQYKLITWPSVGYNAILLPGKVFSKNHSDETDHQAILEGKADLLFQSVSDLPYPLPAGLEIVALLEALDPDDSTQNMEQFVFVALANRPELKELFSLYDIRNQYGKITLVGFGPGNPDLLTLGGDKALVQSDIIFHDDLLDQNYLKKYAAEKVYVGKRKGCHCVEQVEINRLIVDAVKAGKQVVRLKGGDPMIFAHGGEEVEYLERNLFEVEVIPGVSSGIAVASLLKVPLTHRGLSSSMAFISGHSENVHLPDADTLVIYMGGSNIRVIARKAIELGWNPEIPVMMVYNLSLPDQQEFFFTLKELVLTEQKFPTPIIIVIGEVVSFRNKSNTELQIANQSDTISNNLSFNELGIGLEKLKSFDWLIFTNRQTVSSFFDALEKNGKDSRFLAGIKIAVAGKKAAAALKEHGILADLIPDVESSEGLISRLNEAEIAPSKVLIASFIPVLSVLQQSLKELGWEVAELIPDRDVSRKNLNLLASSIGKTILPPTPAYQTPYVDKVTFA